MEPPSGQDATGGGPSPLVPFGRSPDGVPVLVAILASLLLASAPAAAERESFTVIVLPDTQWYWVAGQG